MKIQISKDNQFIGLLAKTKPFIGEFLPYNGRTLPVFNIDKNNNIVTCIAFDELGNEFLKDFRNDQIITFFEN
jgi:hypothetical protein